MSEQRIQTIKIVWKGDDAKQQAVEFTRSIKGTDQAVEDLNKVMGENTVITAENKLSKKELTAQARKEFTAANNLVNKYNNLTTSLQNQIKMTNMSEASAEIYAAQMRLGANATKAQKDEIATLITKLQQQRTATGKTTSSMRGLRGQAQNLGWQMQDVAVQMQMGTDNLVIFSQQGSQLASGFGPGGALIGALIAVGGAIAGVIAKTSGMAEIQKIAAVTTDDLTERLYEQAKAGEKLTYHTKQAMLALQDEKIKNTTKALEEQRETTERLTKEARVLRDEREAKEPFAATQTGFSKALDIKQQKTSTDALNSSMAKQLLLEEDLKKARQDRNNILNGKKFEDEDNKDKESEAERAFEAEYKRLIAQTETFEEEHLRRRKIIDDYYNEEGSNQKKAIVAYNNLEDWRTAELQKQLEKRTDLAIKVLEKETKRRNKVIQDAQKEITKGDSTDPVVAEMAKHNRLIRTLYAERNALGMSSYADRQAINALIEQETNRHMEAMTTAEITQMTTAVDLVSSTANMMSSTVDLISNGVEEVKNQTAEMNAFQKGMFLTTQALAATMAVIEGMSLGMKLANALAFTPVDAISYQTFGTSMGAAQAGAIMGTTFAGMFDAGGTIPNGQAGVVAERYDELVGGTMVYNNSGSGLNVTGSKDTAAAMSGGSKINVNVINNATGSVTATVQQIGEDEVNVLIAQHLSNNLDKSVAGVVGKKGTKTDKAMRGRYKLSGNF